MNVKNVAVVLVQLLLLFDVDCYELLKLKSSRQQQMQMLSSSTTRLIVRGATLPSFYRQAETTKK